MNSSHMLRSIAVAWLVVAVAASIGCALGSSGSATDPRRVGSSVERISPVRAAEINTRLGVGYLEQGQLQVAMEKLELAVRQDPRHAPAHLALGIVFQSIGRDDKALEHMKTAVTLAPEDGAAHNNYGVLLCRLRRFEEADRAFRTALEDPFYPTPGVVLANAGSCARRWGKAELAERYLRQALQFDPDSGEALYNLAELSLEQGRLLSARGFLQRLEARQELSADALLLAYRIERGLGSDTMAQSYADRLIRNYPASEQTQRLQAQQPN